MHSGEDDVIMVPEDTPLLRRSMADTKFRASDDALLGNGKKLPQYLGGLAACMAALATGVTMGWSSAAEDHLRYCNATLETCHEFVVTAGEFSWISAFLSIGAMVGAVVSGQVVDKLGRKRLLLVLAPITVIGWAVITWANEVWMYDLGRLITGFVAGSYCLIAPMFTSEIAEKSIRGSLGAFFQLLITTGIFAVYLLDYLFPHKFLVINIVCLITPILMGVAILFLPETPRFYLLKNDREESRKSLKFYRGEAYDVDKELDEVEAVINEEKAQKIPFFTAMRSRAAVKGLILSFMAMIFQQFSGINAIIFYASTIFSKSHIELDAKLASVIMGVFQISSTFLSTFLMDRAGRKLLLLISGAFMSLSILALAVYLYLSDHDKLGSVNLGWLPVICVVVFICGFSIGYGPIPWLYMSEVFSAQIKGPAMAIATVVNWLSVFVVTKFFEDLENAIQLSGTFFLFSGISAVGFICVLLFFLETKNKTLEQVQRELEGIKAPSKGENGHVIS